MLTWVFLSHVCCRHCCHWRRCRDKHFLKRFSFSASSPNHWMKDQSSFNRYMIREKSRMWSLHFYVLWSKCLRKLCDIWQMECIFKTRLWGHECTRTCFQICNKRPSKFFHREGRFLEKSSWIKFYYGYFRKRVKYFKKAINV